MEVENAKDLGNALKNNVEEIVIYDYLLMEKVLKIKATKEESWEKMKYPIAGVFTVGLLLPPVCMLTLLGAATAMTALRIAKAGNGFSALDKLREYQIIEQTPYKIVLSNKKCPKRLDEKDE